MKKQKHFFVEDDIIVRENMKMKIIKEGNKKCENCGQYKLILIKRKPGTYQCKNCLAIYEDVNESQGKTEKAAD